MFLKLQLFLWGSLCLKTSQSVFPKKMEVFEYLFTSLEFKNLCRVSPKLLLLGLGGKAKQN